MANSEYIYNEATGLIVPDTSETLGVIQSEYQTAFSSDLIVTPDTPQGVLITGETIARNNFLDNNAAVANQINPNYAGGVFLDAILALTGVQRTSATPTAVANVTVTGVAGTTIPAGSQAATADGDLFQTTSTVVLPSGGSITVDFQSVANGAIPCAMGALDTIITAVLGWETVNNSTAGVVGSVTQSDQQARAFRQNTLFFQGKSLAGAIVSALYNVPGVTSLTFQENVAATTQTINGISMVAHSVYACVAGGVSTAIAAALLENKSSGAAWNGGTTVNLVEPASGQTYAVKFDTPEQVGILVNATVSGCTNTAAAQAILDYAAGNISGLSGFVVGADVSPFELSGAIMAENPGAYVSLVEISPSAGSPSFSTMPIAIGVNQQAFTQLSFITITVA